MAAPFIWIHELFGKALIKRATTSSAAAAMVSATRGRDYSAYVIRVLEAPVSIRVSVRNALMADHGTPGKEQLLGILTVFETLSPGNKEAYIDAYKGCATLAGQGTLQVVRETGWQSGHVPPYLEP